MSKYVVEAAVTYAIRLEVKAKSKEEAETAAIENIFDGEGEPWEVLGYEIDEIRKKK